MTNPQTVARALLFYDDALARTFEPFALSRPLSEMRVGAVLMRERWELALRSTSVGFIGAGHLRGFSEPGVAHFGYPMILAGTVIVNSRAAIALHDDALVNAHREDSETAHKRGWFINDRLAAVQLRRDVHPDELASGSLTLESIAADNAGFVRVDVDGVWLDEVWDAVHQLTTLLQADIPIIAKGRSFANVSSNLNGPVVTGRHALFREDGASIEPFTFFDTTAGPVLISKGAQVQAFTRVVGPCYIGHNSIVGGDRVAACSIGDNCRVHGEIS
ncbi:MAG: putative sugar nucleotidyl transferase, partial [Gemmatimonadaceae bacterium]